MKTWVRRLHRIEDGALVLVLAAMILLASAQILMRDLFDQGLVWIDPLLRILVLWLAMIGAGAASRGDRHLRVDLLSRRLSSRASLALQGVVHAVTAAICGLIAWHGSRWVGWEYDDALAGYAGVPAWMLEIIIPFAFALMALRYGLRALRILRLGGGLMLRHGRGRRPRRGVEA